MSYFSCSKCGYTFEAATRENACVFCNSSLKRTTELQLRTHLSDPSRYRHIDRKGRPLAPPDEEPWRTDMLDRELALVFDRYKKSFGDEFDVGTFLEFVGAAMPRLDFHTEEDAAGTRAKSYLDEARRILDRRDESVRTLGYDECPACGNDLYPERDSQRDP